jgi:quercetin dioxygenase-like cupin family protein
MLVRQAEQVQPQPMTMPGASGVSMRLLVGRETGAPNYSMRLFEVEPAGHTPLHQHNYEHEVLILEGSGQLAGGEMDQMTLRPIQHGDVVFIPANEPHQFRNNGVSPLKFICIVPTTHDCGSGCVATPGS